MPGKNLATVGGVTLVGRAVRVAKEVSAFDEVLVSTDDDEIAAEAERQGASVDRRASKLALDTTPTIEVLREYLARQPQVVVTVLLQPTSPLRAACDVRACLDQLHDSDSATTVTRADHPPQWIFDLGPAGRLEPVFGWEGVATRRQDVAPSFRLNGAVYAARADKLRAGADLVNDGTVGILMPAERSIDIDSELDLAFARLIHDRVMPPESEAATSGPSR